MVFVPTKILRITRIASVVRRIGYARVKKAANVFPIALCMLHVCPTPQNNANKPVRTMEITTAVQNTD